MVERYFAFVTTVLVDNNEQEISPLVKSFSIGNVKGNKSTVSKLGVQK